MLGEADGKIMNWLGLAEVLVTGFCWIMGLMVAEKI